MTDELSKLPFFKPGTDPAAVLSNMSPAAAAQAPRGPGAHLLAAAQQGQMPPLEEEHFVPPVPRAETPIPRAPIDWATVAVLRTEVSNMLTASLEANPNQTEQARVELARAHIKEVIDRHVEGIVRTVGDRSAWNEITRQAMQKAVLDSLFGLGRLQPLVDEEGVENIDITGYDNVFVNYADGTFKKVDPIASSDAELMAELQFLAARGGENGRPFSATNPILDMDLPGGARLAAVAPPIAPRPKAVIRIHRFVDITLDDLVYKHGTMTRPMAQLLGAAVHAGRSIVVAGHPGAGKTTLVRALSSSIDPLEPIVTIEKERELHLDRMGDRHLIVAALQYRPGQGERAADGSQPGEVTLVQLLEEALRLNAQRIIVGEVRGGEIDAMFQAMQAGVGSLSTIHADSATNAIERMATLTTRGMNASDVYAYRQISQHIDFVVQISKVRQEDGTIRRLVTEIAEIQPGEDARPIASILFGVDPVTLEQGPLALPTPATLALLRNAGLDEKIFRAVA
jgi:type IV secretory pathway ATPase VirB11/archaellum biosynthesis ATPase